MEVDIFTTGRRYEAIYADPPWSYASGAGRKSNKRGCATGHYNTMATEDICGLPVQRISAEKAILFMWATFPNIKEALRVMEAWGFEYKTAAFVWVKRNKKSATPFWGMGTYTRANAEVCLLGIGKGTRAADLVKRHNIHQIIYEPVMEHSKKPSIVRQRIMELLGGNCTILSYLHGSRQQDGIAGGTK